MNPLVFGIGRKIRTLRTEKGYTLADLAAKTDVSTSLISQLERGGINPSISLLKAISDALDTPLAAILQEEGAFREEPSPIVSAKDRKTVTWEGGVSFGLLSKNLDVGFEFIVNEWPPGSSTGKKRYVHEGVECGIVLQGEIEVELGNKVYRLKPGDSITFRSDVPHRLTNKGKKTARAVWVNSIPWIFSIK